MTETFRALVLDQADRRTTATVKSLPADALPPGEVLVEVRCSTLNYKDALAITGAGKIVREFPFVPGIDLAGTVRDSASPDFRPGDEVILTGWGVGERHWGGLAELARVRAEWLLPLPNGLTAHRAMAIGTAGLTAALSLLAIEDQGVGPDDGPVVVTGAAGGVGSIAVQLLAMAGFHVAASTGRPELRAYLEALGAAETVERKALAEGSKAPLDSQRWAAAVDTVGSATLANLLKAMRYRGVVAACGLAGGSDLPATVFPFILRGVRLIGIESVTCPVELRRRAWDRLVRDLDMSLLDGLTRTIGLREVAATAPDFLAGKVQGRIVVDVAC